MDKMYKDCDHILKYENAVGTRVDGTTEVLNNGTCTFTITDKWTGTVFLSGTIPYVATSNGNYRITLDSSDFSSVVIGRVYEVTITLSCDGFDDEVSFDVIGARKPK